MSPAIKELKRRNITFKVFIHQGPLRSLEQAAQERDQSPQQVVRSILFRIEENQYVMVLMPGPQQVNWSALRKYIGQSRLTMATELEVRQATGYEIGAVTPFGLPKPIPILVDQSLLAQSEISLGSGLRGIALMMKVSDLIAALDDHEIVNLSKT
jgi:Cys-tRNA(Pro)/Cys-tRNA(Cys) deacylase